MNCLVGDDHVDQQQLSDSHIRACLNPLAHQDDGIGTQREREAAAAERRRIHDEFVQQQQREAAVEASRFSKMLRLTLRADLACACL